MKFECSEIEAKGLLALIDAGVKATGLNGVQVAAFWHRKVSEAKALEDAEIAAANKAAEEAAA